MSDIPTHAFLAKIYNAWGRGDEYIVASKELGMEKAEERAREIASHISGAELPEQFDWREATVAENRWVVDIVNWQISVDEREILGSDETVGGVEE
ncbi:hypothetical protein [Haladaptatus cibarius]|uniref:hypothetical protein n=1 Tax=Haladaptatus cibarius TaxID=453847 RepID=UPI000679292E|nr:hypothetical protein [Haladaptatus cibarius]